MSVAVVQYRLDYAPRALELKVTNGTDDALEVAEARFVSPAFAGAASRERDATIPAGATRDLRVLLPEAVCAAQDAPEPRIELDVVTADGVAASGSLTPADELGTIGKILAQDCIAEGAGEVAAFETGGALRTEAC